MPIFMDNPPKKRKASKPTRKQLAARAKFAARARARSRAAKSARAPTTTSKETPMATKRRKGHKRAAAARSSAAPRRRRRRKSYRRNPPSAARRSLGRRSGLMGTATELAIAGVSGLGGMAIGHLALTKIGPSITSATDTPTTSALKRFGLGAGVAIGIAVIGTRFVSRTAAYSAAVGALLPAMRDVVVALSPEASSFLGRSDFERAFPGRGISGFAPPSRARMAGYATPPALAGYATPPANLGNFSPGGFSRDPWAP